MGVRGIEKQELLQANEFARKAGVTVRTLHVYDRMGLLQPATRSASGYRLYGERELVRLEQILALRFFGLGLDRIKTLLDGPPHTLAQALDVQRSILIEEQRRLNVVLEAIDGARNALDDASRDRWDVVRNVIEVFKMKNDVSWTENYYSPEALEKLAKLRAETPPEVIHQGERDWAELIAEVEAACRTMDPSSDDAKALARRWSDLVGQFTKGDPDVEQGLNRLWSDRTHWPKDFKKPYSDEAEAFIREAQRNLNG